MNFFTITGIDGSGKSEFTDLLINHSKHNSLNWSFIKCPKYHEYEGALYKRHSILLATLNALGDKLNYPTIKVVAVFLQLHLFKLQLNIIMDKKPEKIITERHPIIDSLIYGPYFLHKIERIMNCDKFSDAIVQQFPNWQSLIQEIISLCPSINRFSFDELPGVIIGLYQNPLEKLKDKLQEHFQVPLPNTILWLKISSQDALHFISQNRKTHESHEDSTGLELLAKSYRSVLEVNNYFPTNIKILPIANGRNRKQDDVLRELIEKII